MSSAERAAAPDDNSIPINHHDRVHDGGNDPNVATKTTDQREKQAFLVSQRTVSTFAEPRPIKRQSRLAKLLTMWWFEAGSLVLAIATLVSIAVTMSEYDQKEQPAWKYSINLNTLIAILSTFLRICLVFVVEEIVSQLKWMWFRRPKPLEQLSQFDTAARGPWGSLLLLFRIKRFDSALIGCIVIILSFGISPFSQQAVKSVPCYFPLESGNSSIPISRWIDSDLAARRGRGQFDLEMGAKTAIFDGLANSNAGRFTLPPSCSTGNCSFPSYQGITHSTIGMCKKCVNLTPAVKEVHKRYDRLQRGSNETYQVVGNNLEIPGGLGVGGGYDYVSNYKSEMQNDTSWIASQAASQSIFMNVSTVFDWEGVDHEKKDDEEFLAAVRASFLNIGFITLSLDGCSISQVGETMWNTTCPKTWLDATPYWDSVNVLGSACTFYPCLKNYHGEVVDTVYTETLVSEVPTMQDFFPLQNASVLSEPCLVDNVPYVHANISDVPRDNHTFEEFSFNNATESVPSQCLYGVQGQYIKAMAEFMWDAMTGECEMASTSGYRNTSMPFVWKTVTCEKWWQRKMFNDGYATFKSFDDNMEAVVAGVTREMRTSGSDWNGQKAFAKGVVMRTSVCTQFDWVWLIFPIVLTALTTLLMFIMCAKTLLDKFNIPVWKSSVLPMLFTGNGMGKVGASKNMQEMKKESGESIVSLTQTASGWELLDGKSNVSLRPRHG